MKKRIKVKSAIVMSGVVAALLGMGGVGQAQASPFADSLANIADDLPRTRDVGEAYKSTDLKVEAGLSSTQAVGEESKKPELSSTQAVGEEGGNKKPIISSTMAVGEEGGGKKPILSSTMAIGEESKRPADR